MILIPLGKKRECLFVFSSRMPGKEAAQYLSNFFVVFVSLCFLDTDSMGDCLLAFWIMIHYVCNRKHSFMRGNSFLVLFFVNRHVFKLDELGREIAQIALPAALALAADPVASLVDTAFIGQIGNSAFLFKIFRNHGSLQLYDIVYFKHKLS